MAFLAVATLLSVLLHLGASFDEERLFRPIKGGQDVGLVIIPGAYVLPEQYYAIAQELQEASVFALWVYVEDEPTATLIPRRDFVVTARGYLREAGLPEDAPYISIGHSMGGAFMLFEVEETPSLVDGLITWGADGFITSENAAIFGFPAMTAAGDLDGMTRVTNMAKQFRDLSSLPEELRLQCPVRTMQGLNHMSYATGNVPLLPGLLDLPAEIEGKEAREIIARDNSFIIDFAARKKLGLDISQDLEQLREWYNYQSDIYAPLLNALDMEQTQDGKESPWVKEAQRIIAAAYDQEVYVQNYVLDRDGLVASRSSVQRIDENTVLVNTTTAIATQASWSSAKMLEAKMSSKEALDEVLDREPEGTELQCKNANIELWNRIFPTISELARTRYEARDYNINFKDDEVQVWGPGWVLSEMEFSADGKNLNITSSTIKVAPGAPSIGGAHYCKLLSPFRVIEFLYIDSLRPDGF